MAARCPWRICSVWWASAATCAPSRSFERGGRVSSGPRDDEPVVLRDLERRGVELAEYLGCEPAHVLALESAACGDRRGIARGVAIALLDLRCCNDDVVHDLRDRAVRCTCDQPGLPCEAANGLQGQPRPAFVRDRDEHVGLRRVPDDDLERLRGVTTRLRGVERCPAADEEHARSLGEPPIADAFGHLAQPFGLRRDRLSGQLSIHETVSIPSTELWPSSRRPRSATASAS
jgi:hypothetical protein